MEVTVMSGDTLKWTRGVIMGVARKYGLRVLSIVLYGSRARREGLPDSDYDFFILLEDGTSLLQFTQFSSELRMKLYRAGNVKVYSNTVENFKRIMAGNPFLGSFCYIIASEGIPLYDPRGVFKKLQDETENLTTSEKIAYVKKCLAMSKTLGSVKWAGYWKRRLELLKRCTVKGLNV